MSTKNPNTSISAAEVTKTLPLEITPDFNYSEIPGLTSPSVDVLNQFQGNLKLLSELHFKLNYVLTEIKSVIK